MICNVINTAKMVVMITFSLETAMNPKNSVNSAS